ncbi:nuclear transport factor 2 family protein [Burkholderia sp. 4M9327F10]|nr:nuclear transport factor 2 family protein [Burkholderia sp. 4M9327F10]
MDRDTMEAEFINRTGAQAVLNVVHGYAWGYDANDMALLASVFDEDAITGGVVNGTALGWGPWKGQRAILEGLGEIRRTQTDRRRHQLTTPVFLSLTDEEAILKVYLSIVSTLEGEKPRLLTTGHYLATLHRSLGKWKIRKLDAELDDAF